jgi:F-type H+-transporting ATPase subunit b
MNIPLNIDWQQILLHLLNFAILAVGLYFLLYKPVKSFMDKRTAYYKQMDDEAREKSESAESLKRMYQAQLDSASAEIAQMKAAEAKEAEKASASQLQEAKAEAERILRDAKANAAAERDKITSSAQQEIAELAAEAVEKIAQKSLTDSYDEFLKAVGGGEVHGKQN